MGWINICIECLCRENSFGTIDGTRVFEVYVRYRRVPCQIVYVQFSICIEYRMTVRRKKNGEEMELYTRIRVRHEYGRKNNVTSISSVFMISRARGETRNDELPCWKEAEREKRRRGRGNEKRRPRRRCHRVPDRI